MPDDRPPGAEHAVNDPTPARTLLNAPVGVVNIGLASFADDLRGRGVPVAHVDWSTARVPEPRLAALLAKLGT